MERAEFLRKQAERFLALAQECADPNVKAKLVEMAKKDMKLTQTHSVEEAAARHGVKYGKRAKW